MVLIQTKPGFPAFQVDIGEDVNRHPSFKGGSIHFRPGTVLELTKEELEHIRRSHPEAVQFFNVLRDDDATKPELPTVKVLQGLKQAEPESGHEAAREEVKAEPKSEPKEPEPKSEPKEAEPEPKSEPDETEPKEPEPTVEEKPSDVGTETKKTKKFRRR